MFAVCFTQQLFIFMLLFSGVSSRRRLWALKQQLMECRYWIIHWHRLTLKKQFQRPNWGGRRSWLGGDGRWAENWTMKLFSLQNDEETVFLRLFPFLKIQKLHQNKHKTYLPQTEPPQAASPLRWPLQWPLSDPSTCTGFALLCKCCSLSQRWFNVYNPAPWRIVFLIW